MLRYACPDCGRASQVHGIECDFDDVDIHDIEKAYVDIISYVLVENSHGNQVTKDDIEDSTVENWSSMRHRVYGTLKFKCYLQEDSDGYVTLVDPDKRKDLRVPTQEPIQTVWSHGTVPGCHDNGIFSLIAWHAVNGFSWEETRERVLQWFQRTETWDRGGFAEASPEEVVDGKEHVYESKYGWRQKAEATKNVIESSS